jgi:glyoxylase-like metal-dependent hydrolase (beta-lactamase superfamily II)
MRLSNLLIWEEMIMKPEVKAFFREPSNTISDIVKDPGSNDAAIIDPVLDFDARSGRTSATSADQLIANVEEQVLGVPWALETHVHADRLSVAPYSRSEVAGHFGIDEHITKAQILFKKLFNVEKIFSSCRSMPSKAASGCPDSHHNEGGNHAATIVIHRCACRRRPVDGMR